METTQVRALREWLNERWASPEIEKSVIDLFQRTEKTSDTILGKEGGISMAEWLETTIVDLDRHSPAEAINWMILGLADCSLSILEMEVDNLNA